jgi:hypothetical protein
MAFNRQSVPTDVKSGALADIDPALIAAGVVGVSTVGAATMVGAMILPGQIATGLATAGGLAGAAEVRRRTGSYLPFLKSKDEQAVVVEASAA